MVEFAGLTLSGTASFSVSPLRRFKQCCSELTLERWDQRIEADSELKKLDSLIAEVHGSKKKSTLREL